MPDEDSLLKVALYRAGTIDKTYYFILNKDGTLEVALGERKNNDISSSGLLKVISESKSKQLTSLEFDELLEHADEIEMNTESLKKITMKDGWDVIVYYNSISYELNYTKSQEAINGVPLYIVSQLIDFLIDKSPVEVDFNNLYWHYNSFPKLVTNDKKTS